MTALRLLALAGCAMLAGCATDRWSARCAWGAATAAQAAHCARVNFGDEGTLAILMAINREVVDRAAGAPMPWPQHVEHVLRKLEPYAHDFAVQYVDSCHNSPDRPPGSDCHTSLLVTDRVTGARFVLDNGQTVAGGARTATLAEFTQLVDTFWVATPPRLDEAAKVACDVVVPHEGDARFQTGW